MRGSSKNTYVGRGAVCAALGRPQPSVGRHTADTAQFQFRQDIRLEVTL